MTLKPAERNLPRVLVVDDEVDLAEIIALQFEHAGLAQTVLAHSGQEAVAALGTVAFDFVLSDIRMANGDGVWLLSQLKQNCVSLPPFLFMTGYADLTLDEALEMGALGILSKPFPMDELVERFTKAMASRPGRAAG